MIERSSPYVFSFIFTLLVLWVLIVSDTVFGSSGRDVSVERVPITVTSDRMEVSEKDQTVIFTGNAQAVQGDRILKADSIVLFYRKKSQETKGDMVLRVDVGGELERIVARGRVRVIHNQRLITGDSASYFPETRVVEVTGNARMWDGENIVRGDRITFNLDEKRGKVEGLSEGRRVTAVLIPSKKEDMRGLVK